MDAQLELRVMGTGAHVLVEAASAPAARVAVERAACRLHELERRWSRFLPDSDVSILNAAGGAPVVVHPDTRLLIERAVDGWRRTRGRFDPTVLDALVALGYDRDLDAIDRGSPDPVPTAVPAPGCEGIAVDRVVGTVRLPRGVHFDPGGIGKGLAADLVAEAAMRDGADGVLVNVGGDLRVEGCAPGGAGWVVDLEHPTSGGEAARVRLASGGVASTWRTRRTWGPPDAPRHHLVDPATGASAFTGLAGTAVLGARAWWAEVVAKAAFVAGPVEGRSVIEEHGVAGYLVDDAGTVHDVGAAAAFGA